VHSRELIVMITSPGFRRCFARKLIYAVKEVKVTGVVRFLV